MPTPMSTAHVTEMWDRYQAGETASSISRRLNRNRGVIGAKIRQAGGIRPITPQRAAGSLRLEEREEISRGLAAGLSCRQIAAGLSRSPSTVSREVAANGGRDGYRATLADRAAEVRRRRPKTCKLGGSRRLRAVVVAKLKERWSPEQIAGWLREAFPDDPEMQVSHETIYRTLFLQSRGALKTELTRQLRTGRRVRRPGSRTGARGQGRGQLVDIVHIFERPAEVEDRAVPGHWEGDLILGTNASAIATMVERSTRFVMLVKVDGMKSAQVVPALRDHVLSLPAQLARSITWDQGKEMALHAQFTIDTGVQIYFCDPKSPWQRGSNENTNGLLRQYFPRRNNLRLHTQAELDTVAAELNRRPRKTLGFQAPSQMLDQVTGPVHALQT